MSPVPRQKEFFARPTPTPGTVFVNDRVCVQTEDEQRVVFVHGIIFSHYPIADRTAEAYAMVALFETGYADQNDIPRCIVDTNPTDETMTSGFRFQACGHFGERSQVLPSDSEGAERPEVCRLAARRILPSGVFHPW